MLKLDYLEQSIEYTVKYRKRKTMEIRIISPGKVIVIAPLALSEKIIFDRVKSKSKWITEKLIKIKEMEDKRKIKEYVNGEKFMYLGKEYPLSIIYDESLKKSKTVFCDDKFFIYTPSRSKEKLKKSMENWYREKSLEHIMESIDYYQKYFNCFPLLVKVKEQKKRWGSCNSKKHIYFNWRCSMAPISVLNYIVVHEMCHLIHMNHSQNYWNLVKSIMPNYIESKNWLKEYGIMMEI